MSAVTLPGALPGLLRRGAPVVATSRCTNAGSWDGSPTVGVVSGELGYDKGRPHLIGVAYGFVLHTGTPDWYALDLTDPAGRDIAVRWYIDADGTAEERIRRMADADRLRDNPEALRAACLAIAGAP